MSKLFFKNLLVTLVFSSLLFCMCITPFVHSANNVVMIYCLGDKKAINGKIFGNNLLAYNPKTYERNWRNDYFGYTDYVAGLWDGKRNKPTEESLKLLKSSGARVLRFPGGCGSHGYDWKKTIGKNREHYLFGLDEFLRVCRELGAEPVITISYFTGTPQDAADMVEYLNAPDDGKHTWAAKRAQNGHKEPYSVKYFEIGNEVWHGNHITVKSLSARKYARDYLKYYDAMKAVDAGVYVGVVLMNFSKDAIWDKNVMGIVKDKTDFAVTHIYPTPIWGKKLCDIPANEIFKISLAQPVIYGNSRLGEMGKILKDESGKTIPVAITEFNGGFVQDKPVPYRHAMGNALVNAELLRVFMKPENNILMANYWNFCNEYWGMVANGFKGDPKDLYNPYYKRPNYYVFEMYHKHFGGVLLKAQVSSDTYDISGYDWFKTILTRIRTRTLIKNNLAGGKWSIKELAGVAAQESNGELEIDFSNPVDFNYYHCVKKASVEPGTYYKVSGYIKTGNFIDDIGMCLEVQDARGWNATRSAVSTEKVKNAPDWQYVEAVYRTLPDAKEVNVIARRIGNSGSLSGKVYFKDVKLEKFIPQIDSKIPYLSVNASKSKDGKKVYLMVVNKNLENTMTTTINLNDFTPKEEAQAFVLNGPSVDATNEQNHDNVKIRQKKFKIPGNQFEYTFEPHSLTAIEIEAK